MGIHFGFDCSCTYFYIRDFTQFYHNFVMGMTHHYQDNFSSFKNLSYFQNFGFG